MQNRIVSICLTIAVGLGTAGVHAAQNDNDTQVAEDAIARRHAERFLDVLRRRPSFGTALQRVSDFHLERGTLDNLIRDLREDTKDDVDLLIAGMLQVHRGHGEEAVGLLQKVEKQRSADPVASQALARAFRDAGDTKSAIAAFERAVERNPTKPDLRTVYQNLARLHQRAGFPERALGVWKQLESTFPQDRLIQEDVAARLQESGQLEPALERWERLAAETTNPEQRTQYRLNAADIQVRLNRNEQALGLLNSELQQIRSGSWLDRLIRKKVERVLLATGGRSAIVDWYRERVAAHPDDTGSLSRLADLLVDTGQFDEAESLYVDAIERQPSSLDLRVAFVELLVTRNEMERACVAGEQLAGLEGAGTDEFELVGRLLLHRPGLSRDEREAQASAMWQRICGDETDAVSLGYTARLHYRNGLVAQAVGLFRRTIQLDPDNTAWREELGRCLVELGNTAGAIKAWNEIAAGDRRSVRTLVILSEILESAQQQSLALEAMRQACDLAPTIADRISYAVMLQQNGQQEACYEQLDLAFRQAESVADRRIVLDAKVSAWQRDPGLLRRTSLLDQADNGQRTDGLVESAWMYHTAEQHAKAVVQCERAVENDPTSILAWESAAAICLAAGLLDRASEANRQLAELSPSARITALQQVVRLEQQLGRSSAAIDAAGLLVKETPGHVSSCRQFADLCFETGRDADGISCLRQCLRLNPDDHRLAVDAAQILAGQFQTSDAEAVLWQCFERTEDLSARLRLLDGLIELAQQTGTVAQLTGRLQASSRLEPVDRIVFVATVQTSQDELDEARNQLEQGLLRFGRDERLLRKIVEVAELQKDFEAASEFQQQLADVSGQADEQIKLADLKFRSGEMSESELAWIRDARSGNDTAAAIRSIDRFLDGGRVEAAELMSQRLVTDRPADWRVLYRLAMIQWRLGRKDESVVTLQKIIELDLPSDHTFAVTDTSGRNESPLVNHRVRRINQIVESLNWLQLYTGNELWSERLTAPPDYGAARCVAVGFRWLAADSKARESKIAAYVATKNATLDELTDWCGIVVASRWETSGGAVGVESLLSVLDGSVELDARLLTAGLLANGGPFRRPVSQMNSGNDQSSRLMTAAATVAEERPEWLSDVGGWSAVYRCLTSNGQTASVGTIVERLAASPNSATQLLAARLAILQRDLPSIEKIVNRLLPLSAEDPDVDAGLHQLSTQLMRVAETAVRKSDWKMTRKATDLYVRLHAARYAAAEDTGSGDSQRYTVKRVSKLRFGSLGRMQQQISRNANVGRLRSASPFVMISNGRVRFRGHPDSEITIEFNEHLDQQLFSLLFMTGVRQSPNVSEIRLMAHLQQVADDRTDSSWITASVTLGFYSIAMGDAEAGMRLLLPVVECLPHEVALRLVVVQYLAARSAHESALKLLNQLPSPTGRDEILQQEQFALRLCVETGDHERARVAATRLFELSLEPEIVNEVSQQLQTLGLQDVAERFRSRIGGTPSTRAEQLRTIMLQYRDRGNLAAASRIARQFVLQPSVTLEGASATESVSMRNAAIRLLADADHLDPLIRQLRRRVNKGNASFYQHHILVELLSAAGREDEATEAAQPLRESLVGDTEAALQLARQLERQGQLEAACTVCRYLLEVDGALFHRDYYRFIRLFERTGQLNDLADLLIASSFDSAANGHWGIQQLAERLLPRESSRKRGLLLFQKAWAAWPRSRVPLLANVTDESIWSLPEVYEYGVQQLLPTADRTVGQWAGIADSFYVRGRGLAGGTLSQLLVVPESMGKLAEFRQAIQDAVVRQSDWHAGRVYAAVLMAKMGDPVEAVKQLENMPNEVIDQIPLNAAWVIASELHRVGAPELNSMVVRLLTHVSNAQQNGHVLLKAGGNWDESVDYLLVQYLSQEGDAATTGRLLQALVRRQEKQAQGPAPGPTALVEAPLKTLIMIVQSNLPKQAAWFRESSNAVRREASSEDRTLASATLNTESQAVIQMIEDALLR